METNMMIQGKWKYHMCIFVGYLRKITRLLDKIKKNTEIG